eukprot:1157298-Pelagomonas_calceolata.AAC.5
MQQTYNAVEGGRRNPRKVAQGMPWELPRKACLSNSEACLLNRPGGLSVDPSLAALAQWQLMQTAATAESEVTSLRHQRWHRPEPPNPFK